MKIAKPSTYHTLVPYAKDEELRSNSNKVDSCYELQIRADIDQSATN
jgi:hypothetical protein